jgi:hypothetical protein
VSIGESYSPGDPKPLGGYALLTLAFNGLLGAYVMDQARRGEQLPEHVPASDIVLMATATHKLSRLIAKDRVTSFPRAPFSRFQEDAGPSEVSEEARGSGLQRAVGELLVCPSTVDGAV